MKEVTMTIINTEIASSEVLVAVQRYDSPEIRIGMHEYSNKRYVKAPQLMSRSEAVLKINAFLDEDFEEIDPFQVSQFDGNMYVLIKGSLPIEFHKSWADGDQSVCDRIRVFVKTTGEYDPNVPHCSKELRFRDAAGLDGGGHVQCLSELYPNGTCPKTSLHHDVWIASRSRTECTYGENHVAGCTH
jgi:hypothetical protein